MAGGNHIMEQLERILQNSGVITVLILIMILIFVYLIFKLIFGKNNVPLCPECGKELDIVIEEDEKINYRCNHCN